MTEAGSMELEHKAITAGVEVKDAAAGVVEAQFATLGVKDWDGDLIEPGAFGAQRVKVSAFGHGSWMGELPVGVGTTREEGDKAIGELQFFMSTGHGRDHFETVKGLGDLGDWSFGFDVLEEAAPDEEQRQAGIVRILKKLLVHEVSPVLRGAGVDTRTLSVKCDACAAKETGPGTPSTRLPASEVDHTMRALASARVTLLELDGEFQPDADARHLGRFAAACGQKILGGRYMPGEVRWFKHARRPDADGWMRPGSPDIWLALELRGEKIVQTALHEVKHHDQLDPRGPGAEADADQFAKRWLKAVAKAFRWTGGDVSRVSVSSHRRPSFPGTFRGGDIVLAAGRAWTYTPGGLSAWS